MGDDSILSIYPIKGSELGGTLVKVDSGYSVDRNVPVSCCFGRVRVNAEFKDSTITCLSPSKRPGRVDFTVTNDDRCGDIGHPNNVSYISPRTTFEYTIMATIFSAAPKIGSENTQIGIIGSGFRNTTDLSCQFGEVCVPAHFVSESRLVCSAPQIDKTGSVPITVSNNGVDVEGRWANAKFQYAESPLIHTIDPAVVPSSGGTTLFLRGNNFWHKEVPSVFCKFGDEKTANATLVRNDEIACVTPVLAGSTLGRTISVSVSVDGGYNYYSSIESNVNIHLPAEILFLYPRSAPEMGDVLVKVYGRHFPKSPHLACQFGDETVFAIWRSTSLIECITPTFRSGVIDVRVSTNGQDSGLSNQMPFVFLEARMITSINPKHGPLAGGSTVFVRGTGFSNNTSFICRFGNTSEVAIAVINSTVAQCRVPKLNSEQRRVVSVEMSANNGQVFTSLSDLQYTYFPLLRLMEVEPRMGPARGGTELSIFGSFSQFEPSDLSCRFKIQAVPILSISEVFTIQGGKARCVTPPLVSRDENQPTVVSIDIVLREDPTVVVVSSPVTFTYYPKINVSSLVPEVGSELGGANVTILGNFLRTNEITCKFGDRVSPFGLWVSRTSIVCTLPPAEVSFLYQPRVNVSVALNGIDYEKAGVFTYTIVSHISSIVPAFGYISGGTSVMIKGEGFITDKSSMVLCFIGDSLAEAQVISSSLVKCLVPPSPIALTVPVQISFDEGRNFVVSDSNFTYLLFPSVHGIIPPVVPTTVPTKVRVYGANFCNQFGSNVFLSFGNVTIKGELVDNNHVAFTSPLLERSESSYLQISTNGVDFFSSGPLFSVLEPPLISSISPLFSYGHGGTAMLLEGSGLQHTKFLSCIFRSTDWEKVVTAEYISPFLVSCNTPEVELVATTKVSVEFSTFQRSSIGNHFFEIKYYPSISIVSVSPSFFPVSGGFHMEVAGYGFRQQDEKLHCEFDVGGANHVYVKAHVESDELLRCVTPKYSYFVTETYESNLALAVKHETIFIRATIHNESYGPLFVHKDISIDKISPNVVDDGGESSITLYGRNFVNSTGLFCSFSFEQHILSESARFNSPSVISCGVPRVSDVTKRPLMISHVELMNDNNQVLGDKGLPLYHRASFQLEAIHPNAVPEKGGLNVTVFGHNFFSDETLSCVFIGGHLNIKTQARFTTSRILECTVPPLEPGSFSITVSTTSVNSSSDLFLYVFPSIHLSRVVPGLGPLTGGTKVTIFGQTFVNTTEISCWFGDIGTRARFLSSSKIECTSPPSQSHEPQEVNLTISQNNVALTGNSFFFMYTHLPKIVMLSPYTGISSIGSKISIHGDFLIHENGNTVVRVGDILVKCESAEVDRVDFMIPEGIEESGESSQIPVSISSNGGVDFSTSSAYIKLRGVASISSISPQYGPEDGGNLVVLSGENFYKGASSALCRFGVSRVQALVVSPNLIECIAPKAVSPGPVRLGVTMNGKDWTDEPQFYTYDVVFDIFEVEPQTISSAGNILLRVKGSNFLPNREIFCSFGEAGIRKAFFVSPHEIGCVSPATSLCGSFDFDLVSSGRISMLRETIELYFEKSPRLEFWPMVGDMRGGTEVNIALDDQEYAQLEDVHCVFDISGRQLKMKARKQNSTLIGCITPELQMESLDLVSSTIGIYSASRGYLAPSSDAFFIFKRKPSKCTLVPTSGSLIGGTKVRIRSISKRGIFFNSESSVCRFGSATVKALWISAIEVLCVAPPVPKEVKVYLEVSDNGQEFTSVGVYSYQSPPVLKSIFPTLGFIHTQSSIRLEILDPVIMRNNLDEVQCAFYASASSERNIANGRLLNSTDIFCETPAFDKEGDVHVSVSINGQDFSDVPLVYKVQDPIDVRAIFPESGLLGQRTNIRLSGHFPNSTYNLQCLLKGVNYLSRGRVITVSSKEIRCEVSCPQEFQGNLLLLVGGDNTSILSGFQHLFKCDFPPYLKSVEPSIVVTNNERLIVVRGENFRPSGLLSCSFSHDLGLLHSRAMHLKNNVVVCETPAFPREGIVSLSISNNHQDFTEKVLSLKVIEPPLVFSIAPRVVVAGASIVIEGNFGTKGREASCFIGETNLELKVIDERKIECKTPSDIQTLRSATFRIAFDDLELPVLNGSSVVDVIGFPSVINIHPSQGLRFHEQKVMVRGRNFQIGQSKSVSCHFGESIVEAYVRSDFEAECNSPRSLSNAKVPFRLQVGSEFAFSSSDHSFLHMDPWIINEVEPRSSAMAGNSEISIFGKGFNDDVLVNCRFGTVEKSAVIISETLLKCKAPMLQRAGPVDLQLSLGHSGNLISMSNNSLRETAKFYFYPEINVVGISPFVGVLNGGTDIFINGTWTFDSGFDLVFLTPFCRFGEQTVEAFFTRSRLMRCKSPSGLIAGASTVDIYVSMNGFEYVNSNFTFRYEDIIEANLISPQKGSRQGGSLVTISLGKSIPFGEVACRFGAHVSTFAYFNKDKTAIVCQTPTVERDGDFEVFLRLSPSDQWYDTGKKFIFMNDFFPQNVFPRTLREGGGALIFIEGSAFTHPGQLYCRFGNVHILADRLLWNTISCKSPSLDELEYSMFEPFKISVTTNLVDYNYVPGYIKFVPDVIIHHVSPFGGPSRGGTNITVFGSNFLLDSVTVCWFGRFATTASVLSDTVITCQSCPYHMGDEPLLGVELSITQSDRKVISSEQFLYYKSPTSSELAITPSSVPSGTNFSTVTLSGSKLTQILDRIIEKYHHDSVRARLNSKEMDAFYDGFSITCNISTVDLIPSPRHKNSALLEISLNGGIDYTMKISIGLYHNPVLVSLNPSSVIHRFHRQILIETINSQITSENVTCRIGNAITKGGFISETRIICDLPENPPPSPVEVLVPVAVSLNCYDFSPDPLPLAYVVDPTYLVDSEVQLQHLENVHITDILLIGQQDDNQFVIEVMGRNIIPESNYHCYINLRKDAEQSSVVEAKISANSGGLLCLITSHYMTAINIQIIREIDSAYSNSFPFFYDVAINTVENLSPQVMTQNSQKMVWIRGFFEYTVAKYCMFQSAHGKHYHSPIESMSSTAIGCYAPRTLSFGVYNISLSNGKDIIRSNSLTLMVRSRRELLRVIPSHGSRTGNTLVNISFEGEALEIKGDFFCNFGGVEVNAILKGPFSVSCRSPPFPKIGMVQLTVEQKYCQGIENFIVVHDNEDIIYDYEESLVITNIFPLQVLPYGGEVLEISGSPFSDILSENIVKFSSSSAPNETFSMQSTELCHSGVRFIVPPLSVTNNKSSLNLEVANNGIDFVRIGTPLSVASSDSQLISVSPSVFYGESASKVIVKGMGFQKFLRDKALQCCVGKEYTLSSCVSSEEVVGCSLPHNLNCGNHGLSLVSCEQFETNALHLSVRKDTKITKVSPLAGPFSGKTTINIVGSGFDINSWMLCNFETSKVDVVIFNDTHAACHSPPLHHLFPSSHRSNGSDDETNLSVPTNLRIKILHDKFFGSLQTNREEILLNATFIYYPEVILEGVRPNMFPSSGNITFIVHGSGFNNHAALSCKVGEASVRKAIFQDSSSIICPIPLADEAFGSGVIYRNSMDGGLARTFVTVAYNAQAHFPSELAKNMVSIAYYELPPIQVIGPLSGPPGTAIRMLINDLPKVEGILCRVGNLELEGEVVPPNELICRTPSLNSTNKVYQKLSISISLNGIHFNEVAKFVYSDAPIVKEIEPRYGPKVGGNEVMIQGANFYDRSSLQCVFGDVTVKATFISQHIVKCTTPPHKSGMILVRVIVSDDKVEENISYDAPFANYTYLEEIKILSLHPKHGSSAGNTFVRVFGSNFLPIDGLVCIFGQNEISQAQYFSENEAKCIVPSKSCGETKDLVTVKVGLEHQLGFTILSNEGAIFLCTPVPYIENIYPTRSLLRGGEKVLITGNHFYKIDNNDSIFCSFGQERVNGTWLSNAQVECMTPSMPEEVSTRTVQRITFSRSLSSSFDFNETFFTMIFRGEMTQVQKCDLGPVEFERLLEKLSTIGDVFVTKHVSQNALSHEISYSVTFTTLGHPSNAGPLPPLQVSTKPALTKTHGINTNVEIIENACCDVQISTNGVNFYGGLNQNVVPFTFDNAVFVYSVQPNHGPYDGGTRVRIKGSGISHPGTQQSLIYCIFGETYVEAIFLDSTSVECKSPQFPSPANVTVTVEVYSKAEGFGTRVSTQATFEYINPPKIYSTTPETLPMPGPFIWSELDIIGDGFVPSPFLSCLFEGEVKINGSIKIESCETFALYVKPTLIRCLFPRECSSLERWSSFVLVSVTTNKFDWTNKHPVVIAPPHKVFSINPQSGPKHGETLVYIEGKNFMDTETLACKFGDETVKSEFRSESVIVCKTPPNTALSTTIQVTVTNNGRHFSEDFAIFEYYDSLEIKSMDTLVAPSSGGTLVTIELKSCIEKLWDIYCKFNDTQVIANKVDNRTISCIAPPAHHARGGIVSLEVTRNQFDFTHSGTRFMYLPGLQTELLQLIPSHGPKSGNTLVSISGYAKVFFSHKGFFFRPKCKFNDIIVHAEEIKNEGDIIVCRTPPHEVKHQHDAFSLVDISLTGAMEDFTNSQAVFHYDEDITILKVEPDTGGITGGTQVRVFGGPFAEKYKYEFSCRFGKTAVPAMWQSETELNCMSPAATNIYESQNLTIFSMAWNQEIQSISLKFDDYLPELQTISTTGSQHTTGEIQMVQIVGIDDNDEIQRIEVEPSFSDMCVLDISFMMKPRQPKILIISAAAGKGGILSGSFQLYIQNGLSNIYSNHLDFNATTSQVQHALSFIYPRISNVTVENSIQPDGSREWRIIFPLNVKIPKLQVNGNSFMGSGAKVQIVEESLGIVPEIQKIAITARSRETFGTFHLSLKGSRTREIYSNASSPVVKSALEDLPFVGSVSVTSEHPYYDSIDQYYHSSWIVTFESHIGPFPIIKACCDSNDEAGAQTLFSNDDVDDVWVQVERIQKGHPEINADIFQLTFSGYNGGIQVTEPISTNATEGEVAEVIGKLHAVVSESLVVKKGYIDEENHCPTFNIMFTPIVSYPLNILQPGISIDAFSSMRDVRFKVKQNIAKKEVQLLEFDSDIGIISCGDGTKDGLFTFHSRSSGETIRDVVEAVENNTTGNTYYGKVTVRKIALDPRSFRVILIFESIVKDWPTIECNPDVQVSTLANGVKRKLPGGFFQLAFNKEISNHIPYNSTADFVKFALEALSGIGKDSLDVSMSSNGDKDDSRSWMVTFKRAKKTRGDIPLLDPIVSEKLEGFDTSVRVIEVNQGSKLQGTYRLKVKNVWSSPIDTRASASELKTAIEKIPGAHVYIKNLKFDHMGGPSFQVIFSHYEGEEPNGFVPFTAGDIPPMQVDGLNLTGCHWHFTINTIQNGTSSIGSNFEFKGFRLVPPGISTVYPIATMTRWLRHDETSSAMKEALIQTGVVPTNITVRRQGPFKNGSYIWLIEYPLGYSSDGNEWQVVRTGGSAMKLHGLDANVSTSLVRQGSVRGNGFFRILYHNPSQESVVETTSRIPVNASATELKNIIEASLPSISKVSVETNSLDITHTGNGARQWDITFTSLRNIGDVPLLSIDTSMLRGSGAQMSTSERVKGVGNAVYLYKVPSQKRFRIRYGNKVSVMLEFEDILQMTLEDIIKTMSGKRFLIEAFEDEDGSMEIFVLPLSDQYINENTLSFEIYEACSTQEIFDEFCFKYSDNGLLWFGGSSSSLQGVFQLIFNASHELDYLQTSCSERTGDISIHANADDVKQSLEHLNLLEEIGVWKEDDLDLDFHVNGAIGENNRYLIVFKKKSGVCGKNGNLHFEDLGKRDIPLLRVDDSGILGSPVYQASSYQACRHIVDYNLSEIDSKAGIVVPIEISMNTFDYSRSRIMFKYSQMIEVHKLYPNHGYQETRVLLEGKHFFQSRDLRCHFLDEIPLSLPYFHEDWVPIDEYVNETHVICNVPARKKTETVYVFVSIDGFLRSKTMYSTFTYDNSISINEVLPDSGPSKTNFLVVIKGDSFKNTDGLFCKFGVSVVKAMFFSTKLIKCAAPRLSSGIYPLAVTTNGQDFSEESRMVRFYKSASIKSLYPVSGPSIRTGKDICLFGSNFFNSSQMVCKFGSVLVPAQYVTPHEIRCKPPPLLGRNDLQWVPLTSHHISRKGTHSYPLIPDVLHYPLYLSKLVDVEVALNAQDFTRSGTRYLYQDDITVNALSSTSGPTIGNTPIFISGSGYVNTTQLTCRFGDQLVSASFLSRNLILCFSPSTSDRTIKNAFEDIIVEPIHNSKGQAISEVFVEVSNNMVDFTDFHHVFQYHHSVPSGHYQMGHEDATILQCPRGAYCYDSGYNNFTLCPLGTYQPSSGQDICLLCEVGFMCPEEGLSVPRLCPAGYVCDVKGIQRAEQPCPDGFFCPLGTATTETYCGDTQLFTALTLGQSLAQKHTTKRSPGVNLVSKHEDVMGRQASICFDNSTDDFGLQSSPYPSRVWDELRLLPLDVQTTTSPIRGRFCLEEGCEYIDPGLNFDINNFFWTTRLHHPIPCPPGTYCHPGSSSNTTSTGNFSSPQICGGKNYCPKGSTNPRGLGNCPRGFYCRFGNKYLCPVGSYCPFPGLWDPLPCEPGTFNFMVGQVNCTSCPLGHFCDGYGRVDPATCTPGYVCSDKDLALPNMRCPPGYYCPPGTQTSDPFRNDTTLRPYPCQPGSYCPSGCGYESIVEGNFSHAQPCSAGFYCEVASTSAKGSGPCPPSFVCPKGSAVPIPSKTGHYAKYSGTIEATKCLPGFYAPTIQSSECIPCPPGTMCEDEGLVKANFCPPGTYRGSLKLDGIPCITCPQGTWSKNWNLRDKSECVKCASGVNCPTDGMTSPCSKTDLPTPYEPIVNLNGIPMPEYHFRPESRPPYYSVDECLKLNAHEDGLTLVQSKSKHHYFFGELIPPYIDILGRGAHIRITDEISTKYGNGAKCYRNKQARGSLVFEQFAAFYGPQFDLQTGYPHQGYYGSNHVAVQLFSTTRGSSNTSSQYFFSKGISYIPLPRSLKFDPTFNCMPGFSLMNSTLIQKENRVVYTSATYDYEGGVDVEKCSTFDDELNCFIDPTFQYHKSGECCYMEKWTSRAVHLAEDQYYTGTCEADIICSESEVAISEALPCQDGYICGEQTNSTSSTSIKCPSGYICEFGTTPDELLLAPQSKYKKLCEHGTFCELGTGISASESVCPAGYFCPTGTADPWNGALSDDGLRRGLASSLIDPERDRRYLRYFGQDTFSLMSAHDSKCLHGEENSLINRFSLQSNFSSQFVTENTPKAIMYQTVCSRDGKWKLVLDSIRRKECDCNEQLLQIIAVHRLRNVSWKTLIHSFPFSGISSDTINL